MGRAWAAALVVLVAAGCGRPRDERVVVYCAHDREFSESILQEFGKRTGLEVTPRFDSEANKAVGLYEDLVSEKARPRCDLHWNNEILATIRLQRQGILAPYSSPAAEPFPKQFRAADGTWTAFAARARVLIVNRDAMNKLGIPEIEWPKSLLDLTQPRLKDQVAMAKPNAGTTATHAACLFAAWGPEKAKAFYRELRANGVQIAGGNKQVAEGVGRGQYAVGMTDTDDAALELEAGRPVAIVFPDRDAPADSDRGVLFIPNTVAVIRDCLNPKGAQRLVDYLLSPEVEAKLAKSGSKQIPLNPNVKADLPAWMATPATARPLPVDFVKAADCWDEAQTFLRAEFGK
jgi:iron(III) transport system substrate-binding protein